MTGKRKRQDNAEEVEGARINSANVEKLQEQFHEWLLDVLEILREQDTTPSSFDRPIASATQGSRDARRAKLSEAFEITTIASLIQTKAYTTIEDVVKDLNISTSVLANESNETLNGGGATGASQREAQVQLARSVALKKELDRLVRVEMLRRPDILGSSKDVKDEPQEEKDAKERIGISEDNVLTLLANTQPPKQLFSSLRTPGPLCQALGDTALPNGITTTKVIPRHSINEKENFNLTLKDLFAPPASLPPLPIPKPSKHTSTKSSSVNWHSPTEVESKRLSNRRDSFTTQPLSTGQWLTYNVAPSPTQFASPESKRKQRDRALSFGEPQNSVSPETIVAHNQAKEDALFRSVYSSFAPDRDDSGALVAEQQKNQMWWKKYGESKYLELLGVEDAMVNGANEMEIDGVMDEEDINEEELKEAIQNWRPEEGMHEMMKSSSLTTEPLGKNKDADGLLQEISELIEILHSHQRVRNLTIAKDAHAGSGQIGQPSGVSGNPDTPSSAEYDIYEMLQNQLALIVSSLPPYLLSKLDGEKLCALNINTKIQVESKSQKGTMEEGEASAAARARITAPATQTPGNYPSAPARSSSYLQATATPAQQYPRSGYPASTTPRPPTNSNYLQNPQYSNRPTSYSSGHSRPSYPAQGYTPQPPASASASRYNYGQQYGQQSQSSYGSYQNGYRPYSGQNASNYNYNSQYSTPQARASSQAAQSYRGTQTDYQQRAVPPQGYGYGSTQPVGSASPQNQNRSSYTVQGQASSQRPPLHHQNSSGYQSQAPASPQVNGSSASGPVSQPRRMSAEEQAALMERQKAQLAEQPSRQGSGTPQPASGQNGQNGQQNGTPAPEQDNVPT